MATPAGTIIGYSTSPGKVAEDGFGENSPYALALTKAINTPNLKIGLSQPIKVPSHRIPKI